MSSNSFGFIFGKSAKRTCGAYPDAAALFDGLQQEASDAILCLYTKVSGPIDQMARQFKLSKEDTEELIGDCMALMMLKIRTGQYVFQGFDPATYVVEIAKNKVRHFKKSNLVELPETGDWPEEINYTDQHVVEKLEKLLLQISENCRNLIRLKYLEEMRDKDVIEQKITQYTTVDALKNHRAKCLKKLIDISKT